MPPALLLLRFGRMRRFYLPLPLFLLWPLLLLPWVLLGWLWMMGVRTRLLQGALTAMALVFELRGTTLDYRGNDAAIYLKFV